MVWDSSSHDNERCILWMMHNNLDKDSQDLIIGSSSRSNNFNNPSRGNTVLNSALELDMIHALSSNYPLWAFGDPTNASWLQIHSTRFH